MVEPNRIPVEAWKILGKLGIEWLTKWFNKVLDEEKIPDAWRKNIVVPIFKIKWDVEECGNYREIKLWTPQYLGIDNRKKSNKWENCY